jgi:predicted nucleic acid-binding protein
MRIALNTDILTYADGMNGDAMRKRVIGLILGLAPEQVFFPVRVIGELFAVLT